MITFGKPSRVYLPSARSRSMMPRRKLEITGASVGLLSSLRSDLLSGLLFGLLLIMKIFAKKCGRYLIGKHFTAGQHI